MSARSRWTLVAVLLAGALAAGCDYPFEPFQENTAGPFSIYGYLDLGAETQWVRVTPIRQELVPGPGPIDAVVTLEHVESGRVVTLRDSLFTYSDPGLGSVGYAHNFWTTEPLEPGATYRLRAVRSDGAETSAVVEMPAALRLAVGYTGLPDEGFRLPGEVRVEAEGLLYADVVYTVWDAQPPRPGDPVAVRQPVATPEPGTWRIRVPIDTLPGSDTRDMRRLEARFAAAPPDWPFEPGVSAAEVAIPGRAPSNVENGVGFLGGVVTRTTPLPRCSPIEARPDGRQECDYGIDPGSASIVGTVARQPCSVAMALATVRLTQRFAAGGAVVFEWEAGWQGEYRFDGLEPGADLFLEFRDNPEAAMALPALEPGEEYVAPEVPVFIGCDQGAAGVSEG